MGSAAPKELRDTLRSFSEGSMERVCMNWEASASGDFRAGISIVLEVPPLGDVGMVSVLFRAARMLLQLSVLWCAW